METLAYNLDFYKPKYFTEFLEAEFFTRIEGFIWELGLKILLT